MKPYRIAVDALQIGEDTGVERSIGNLCRALIQYPDPQVECHFFVGPRTELELSGLPSNGFIHKLALAKNQKWQRLAWRQLVLPRLARKMKLDGVHFTCYTAAAGLGIPYCLNVYDLIALKKPSFTGRLSRMHYGALLGRSVKRAAKIIAPSQPVAEDIRSQWPEVTEKIMVLPLAVDDRLLAAKACWQRLEIPIQKSTFLLMVGNIEPKKNHQRAIKAFRCVAEQAKNRVELVIVGKIYLQSQSFLREICLPVKQGRIYHLAAVTYSELRWLYQHAAALLFPSLEEGFGLPPLEAAAFGLPVVGANCHSLAALSATDYIPVDPLCVDDICRGILDVLARGKPKNAGPREVKCQPTSLTWQHHAQSLQACYVEICRSER